jgi:hypothetical protein
MIDVGLRELRIHVRIEFLFRHGAIVIGVHCGQPLLTSRQAAGRFLTRSRCRDANNCPCCQNHADCPRKRSIVFQNILQTVLFLRPYLTLLGFIVLIYAIRFAGVRP